MKKTLFLAMGLLLSAFSVNAQTTTWDFSNDETDWPLSAGIGNDTTVNGGLGLFPISSNTNFAAVTNSSQVTFSDGYVATGNRLQTNGAGYGSADAGTAKPTQRFFFIQTDAPATFSAWYKSGSSGAIRTTFVSDGTTILGSLATDPNATAKDSAILTVSLPKAGTFYVYTDAAINFYKMEVKGANVITTLESLATSEVSAKNGIQIFSTGSNVYLRNISGATNVKVYSMSGQLVKSLDTKTDVDFALKAGVYVVSTSSLRGLKSQKVVVK